MSFNNKNVSAKQLGEYFKNTSLKSSYDDNKTLKEKAEYIKQTYGRDTLAYQFANDVLQQIQTT